MSWLAPVALLFAFQDPPARPVVGVEVQPQTVVVGEPFTVRVRVRAAAGAVIRFPAVPDSAGGVEAVDPRAIEDRSTSTIFDQTATYRFIAWEPGRRDVPLGGVRWEHARTADTLAVGRLRVEVTSLLPADTAEQVPRPARAPLDPLPAWWRWALGAAGVLAIALMSWRAWRKRRTNGAVPRDALADAQAGFAAVDALQLVEAGEPGHAVLAYADVMRAYLTRRFPMATDGLITQEYVKTLADNALPILPEEVAEVLEAADAVKFAGAAVDAEDVTRVARGARSVVRDVQVAYEARLAAADKGKGPRGRRRKA